MKNQTLNQLKSPNSSIWATNNFFKQARKYDLLARLCYSEILKMHYIVVSKPKYGFIFENGIFVSLARFERDLNGKNLSNKELEVYIAGLGVFRDDGYRMIGENNG